MSPLLVIGKETYPYQNGVWLAIREAIADGDVYVNGRHYYMADRHYEKAQADIKVIAQIPSMKLEVPVVCHPFEQEAEDQAYKELGMIQIAPDNRPALKFVEGYVKGAIDTKLKGTHTDEDVLNILRHFAVYIDSDSAYQESAHRKMVDKWYAEYTSEPPRIIIDTWVKHEQPYTVEDGSTQYGFSRELPIQIVRNGRIHFKVKGVL